MPCRKPTAPISSRPLVAGGWCLVGYLPVFWGSGSPCAAPLSALGLPSPAQGCWDLGQLSQTRAKPQGTEMGLFPSTLKLGRSCSLFLLPIPQLSSLSLLCLHPWLPPHTTLLHAQHPLHSPRWHFCVIPAVLQSLASAPAAPLRRKSQGLVDGKGSATKRARL